MNKVLFVCLDIKESLRRDNSSLKCTKTKFGFENFLLKHLSLIVNYISGDTPLCVPQ